MRIGIGLPTSTPGGGRLLLEWARQAELAGFSSLGTVDRIVYDCLDPLTALAAAAAVTTRIRLVTMILIAPLRPLSMLASGAGCLHEQSGGRLVLGAGIGARHDDYAAVEVDPRRRGIDLTRCLFELRRSWHATYGDHRPRLLAGGAGGQTMARMARFTDGYVHGGGPPRAFAAAAARARTAWREMGRPGHPELWGQAYFALGGRERGDQYLRDYYAFTGPYAERIVQGNLTSTQMIKELVRGYRDEGCDELVLFPTVSDLGQVSRLAEAVQLA